MMIKKSNLQRKFIIEKMDTMFKFIDNKNAIKEFNKDIEEYRELCKILDEHTANINKQKHYDHIDELNSRLFIELQKIKELEQNIRNNTTITNVATSALIDDIINITIDKIQPLNDEIQNVKYPIMELNIRKNGELYLYQCDELPQFIPL
jgi:HD superfamily phosphodiesterase